MDQVLSETTRHTRRLWWVIPGALALMIVAGATLAILPAVLPSAGAQGADLLRSILGPRAVADLETVSFRIQDTANQALYRITGSRPGLTLGGWNARSSAAAGGASGLLASVSQSRIATGASVVDAPPQLGWQAYGPAVSQSPAMAQALLNADPQRPYAGIALVRMDLSKLSLHMMPGTQEPSHDPSVVGAIPDLGLTPSADVSRLVAGFNGGFKAVNGHYGMMVNGTTLLPPVPGIATLAIYRDGSVRLGAWGTDIVRSADMIAYRQNCPPIILNGQLNPEVAVDDRGVWGNTVGNREITWRTAVGLTRDRRYLIYAVGNATTVSTLAQALLDAGAYNAMQLDINSHFAHFATYQIGSRGEIVPVQLLKQMESAPQLYLVPQLRDYFYVTAK